jgi:hypothetical protein
MEPQAILTDAIRKTSEAYGEALAATMKAIADLPRGGGQLHRQTVEQWLGMARANKDNFVAAVNQGFDIWGRECRRLIGAPHQSGALPPGANPMEVWLENWQRAVAAMTAGSGAVQGSPIGSLSVGRPSWFSKHCSMGSVLGGASGRPLGQTTLARLDKARPSE